MEETKSSRSGWHLGTVKYRFGSDSKEIASMQIMYEVNAFII